MQRCNCVVRLAGDVGNTVPKQNVTVAEITILRAIHGNDAVIDIQRVENDKTPHATERARLKMIYGPAIVEKIFPGEFSKLPVSMEDIALPTGDEEEAASSDGPAPRTKKTIPPAVPLPVFPDPSNEAATQEMASA